MARSKGSLSTEEAKNMAHELEILSDAEYKYNFNYLRLIELLICYRITESVLQFDENTPLEEQVVTVELPLLGNLTISPRVFHAQHRLTNEQSLHFDFSFTPTSGFKSDIMRAFMAKETPLTDIFSDLYSERLKDLYDKLRGGN